MVGHLICEPHFLTCDTSTRKTAGKTGLVQTQPGLERSWHRVDTRRHRHPLILHAGARAGCEVLPSAGFHGGGNSETVMSLCISSATSRALELLPRPNCSELAACRSDSPLPGRCLDRSSNPQVGTCWKYTVSAGSQPRLPGRAGERMGNKRKL